MPMTHGCHALALEQNRWLFASAYQLDHAAIVLLEGAGLRCAIRKPSNTWH
ncbi:hypothetical protein [Pseudomonas mosselii]|uniref:hypothetical protein n=1 Tax=Pseudomonas mosselii TaxID=78327 RepID=UPI002161412E|nr:hypothetical protein [Pseudomonas mosselii]MDH1103221.1 hypothetical protein [Pseudomonas mosselii]MEA3236132.1 hypothetical protein [Pseudomonas mosselii]UVN42106.1 hypothetical protein NW905_13210 [Pseudomonas mosselii]UWS64714.1 hypothetical protein N0U38_12950 [Pseudomonas mosselii]